MSNESNIPSELLSDDWREAFGYASGFTRNDIKRIIAHENGENGGVPWIGVFELYDGRFAYLTAGCDYTGWDCQSGGCSEIRNTLDEIILGCCEEDDRRRLKLKPSEGSEL